MLVSPKKGEAAVHGCCHCSGDMVVGMPTVLATPGSWYVNFSAFFALFTRRYVTFVFLFLTSVAVLSEILQLYYIRRSIR